MPQTRAGNRTKTESHGVRLPADLWELYQAAADERGISRNALVLAVLDGARWTLSRELRAA